MLLGQTELQIPLCYKVFRYLQHIESVKNPESEPENQNLQQKKSAKIKNKISENVVPDCHPCHFCLFV